MVFDCRGLKLIKHIAHYAARPFVDSVSIHTLQCAKTLIAPYLLVIQNKKFESKAETFKRLMTGKSVSVDVVGYQITEPFKRMGTINRAIIFELDDGQTISVYLHNPDVTDKTVQPTDNFVSYKWLLNKRDVTLLVAPENGKDLPPLEVCTRLMKLAGKNSEAFRRANRNRTAKLKEIKDLSATLKAKQKELTALQKELSYREHMTDEEKAVQTAKLQSEYGADAGGVPSMVDAGETPVKFAGQTLLENTQSHADLSAAWQSAKAKANGDDFQAAKEVYRNMQGTYVKTKFGNVLITGAGWKEMKQHLKRDSLLVQTIPFIPQLLRESKSAVEEGLSKVRTGDYVRFLRFDSEVELSTGVRVQTILKVGVLDDGQLVYHLRSSEDGIFDSIDVKKANNLRGSCHGSSAFKGNDQINATFDSSITQDENEINLIIVAAWDKDGSEIDLTDGEQSVELDTESITQAVESMGGSVGRWLNDAKGGNQTSAAIFNKSDGTGQFAIEIGVNESGLGFVDGIGQEYNGEDIEHVALFKSALEARINELGGAHVVGASQVQKLL